MRKFIFCNLICVLLFLSGCKESESAPASNNGNNSGGSVAGQPGSGSGPDSSPDSGGTAGSGKIKVSASGDDGHEPVNTLDGSLGTESRWSAIGDDAWIQYDLGKEYKLKGLDLAFYNSGSRTQNFTIAFKSGDKWIKVFTGASRAKSGFQHFGFYPRMTRYIRVVGNGGPKGDAGDRATMLVEMKPIYDTEKVFPASSYAHTYKVKPGDSIQDALEKAQPGDRVLLAPGRYMEDIKSVRSGTAQRPITIEGPGEAIIQGDGEARVFEINHDYIRLFGFTMDGKTGDGKQEDDYRDKLVYVQGTHDHRGPAGLVIRGMTFRNAGGECLRLRYFIRDADVGFNRFENCGVHDFKFGGKKNGEAIYLGTSSTQWEDGKNPTGDADISSHNRIHHNTFNTQGNECVDIKEGSVNNMVEYNYCTGQKDPSSGGFDSRSDRNTFRYNVSRDNRGAGVRIGGHEVDGHLYGAGNHVYGNLLQDNGAGTIKFMVAEQGDICENTIAGTKGRSTSGDYNGDDPTERCSF
jgi:hypothetical protein